jgi:hypothetical protein
MTDGYRRLLRWTRTFHIYLAMLGLLLLLFFAATGFMLNHPEWFGLVEGRRRTAEGRLPTAILAPVDKLAVVERLRSEFGATGAMDSFEVEEESLRVVFKGPGRQTEATIQRADGQAEVTHESYGLAGLLTDLHRGKATGGSWALIIDAACVLLMLISTTGLILWTSLRTRRVVGLLALLLGGTLCAVIYLALVP